MDSLVSLLKSAINTQQGKPKTRIQDNTTNTLVIGDLHGDKQALDKILEKEHVHKRLEENLQLVFLGDYVDRGPHSIETLTTVCNLVIDHPTCVTLLRGNHEGPQHIQDHSFHFTKQLEAVSPSCRETVHQLYKALPIAAIIPTYAFLVHGHIPHNTTNLEELNNHDEHSPLLEELLWNDPAITPDTKPSFRGHGYYIGTQHVDQFLRDNNLRWIIRGHEQPPKGYETNGHTFTLHTTGPKTTYLKLPSNPTKPPSQYIKHV